MHDSVTGVTYDLLAYDACGNYGQYERCFTKACDYFGLPADDRGRRKLRNIAFRYLSSTGYIDVTESDAVTRWSVATPTLIQTAPSNFVFLGGSRSTTDFASGAAGLDLHVARSSDDGLGLPSGVSFFPHIIHISAALTDATSIAHRAGARLSLAYQDSLFRSLPSINTVLRKGLSRAPDSPLFEPGTTDQFDFSTFDWVPYAESRPYEVGLFRSQFEHAPPSYVVAAESRRRSPDIFRVTEREWALVLALAKLNRRLALRYDKRRQLLHVSRLYRRAPRLPTLLERSFRSGSFLNPSHIRDWVVHEGISQASVWTLISRLPTFEVETT